LLIGQNALNPTEYGPGKFSLDFGKLMLLLTFVSFVRTKPVVVAMMSSREKTRQFISPSPVKMVTTQPVLRSHDCHSDWNRTNRGSVSRTDFAAMHSHA
jgi:hypothetical protein